MKKLKKLESQVAMLQKHVTNLRHVNERKLDDLEQYGRHYINRNPGGNVQPVIVRFTTFRHRTFII